jgi:uncharacterized protein YidB (DUF937 family)
MGLLDGLAGQVLGSLSKSSGAGQGGVVEAISGLIANHPGGLGGLVSEFERGGLGGVVASWVGTGANLPISPDQLQSVLGSEKLQSIAAALGISHQEASSQMAELLPQIVDKLTPAGAVPDQSALGSLLGALRG